MCCCKQNFGHSIKIEVSIRKKEIHRKNEDYFPFAEDFGIIVEMS